MAPPIANPLDAADAETDAAIAVESRSDQPIISPIDKLTGGKGGHEPRSKADDLSGRKLVGIGGGSL